MNALKYSGTLMLMAMVLLNCSSSNTSAPARGMVHQADFLLTHGIEASADIDDCKRCHTIAESGADARAISSDDTTGPTSCYQCHRQGGGFTVHAYPYSDAAEHGRAALSGQAECIGCHGDEPNRFDGGIVSDPDLFDVAEANCSTCHTAATAHPTHWQGSNDQSGSYASSHRSVEQSAIDSSCALCHQVTTGGGQPIPEAPSCFSSSFTNADGSTTGCHSQGPGPSHNLPYTGGSNHGGDAKADLSTCQACHGNPGTSSFSGGSASTACDTCHVDAAAHPTNWQGGNDPTADYVSSHRNSGNQSQTCSICHDFVQGRTAPVSAAPSCFSASFTNSDGSTTGCHPGGAAADHVLPYDDGILHGADAKANLGTCQACHGDSGTTAFDGGVADTACSTCHTAAGAHPTRWQGSNDNTPGYGASHRNSGNQSSTCILCHDYTQGRTAPNTDAPSCYSATFTNSDGSTTGCHPSGVSADHPMPYTSASQHGPDARTDLVACQACHGTVGTTAFDGGIADTACSSCHTDAGAHPTRWQGENDLGSDYRSNHRRSRNRSSNCSVCHDYTYGRTAPNPNAPSCFMRSFTNSDGSATSCHD